MPFETGSFLPSIRTLSQIIDQLSDSASEAAFISMDASGPRAMKRSDVGERTSQVAAGLVDIGVEPGVRIALCGSTSVDWMMVALAILRAGGTVVPIDSLMEEDTIVHIFQDCRPEAVFTDEAHKQLIEGSNIADKPRIFLLDTPDSPAYWQNLGKSEPDSWPEVHPGQEAVLFYTSGTTGPPKGVPLTHANLAFQIDTIVKANLISAGEHIVLPLPLHHVYPFVFGLLTPLAMKVAVVIPQALTGPQLLRAIREGRASAIIGVPRLYRALYEGLHARIRSRSAAIERLLGRVERLCTILQGKFQVSLGPWLLWPVHRQFGSHLRLMASGGATLEGGLAQRLEGVGWKVMVGYGLTETAPLLTMRMPGQGPPESVGRPIPGVELQIDPQAGPKGESLDKQPGSQVSGEILARGPGVFQGYLNLPQETEKVLTQDGWFRTGDLGHFDSDGYLHVTGRVSTRIVTESGENIQPDHLERVIAGHPLIAEAGVLSWHGRLAALVVPDTEQFKESDLHDMQQAMKRAAGEASSSLPSYMQVNEVRVSPAPLSRTRLGKIRRHLLQQRYEEVGREQSGSDRRPVSYQSMSDQDKSLLENQTAHRVWKWLCERFPDRGLSPDSHLERDLGVDSMEWLNLSLEIHEQTGAEISQEAIDQIQSVRDLLLAVVNAAQSAQALVDPVEKPYQALSRDQQAWLTPRNSVQRAVAWAVYWLGSLGVRLFYRVRVEGKHHVSCRGACLLTPNHTSYLDPIVLAHVLGLKNLRHTYWAGLSTVAFNNAFKRFMCRLGQAVPISAEHGAVSGLAFASAILQKNQRLVWFPEGQRSGDGELQALRPGLGAVLKRIPVPVIPVWIEGTYAAWPVSRRVPRPGSIRVTFGQPVEVNELRESGTSERIEWSIIEGLHQRLAELGKTQST